MLRLGMSNRTAAAAAALGLPQLTPSTSAIECQARGMHGKPTRKTKVRTKHSNKWFMQSKSHTLTSLAAHQLPSAPTVPNFPEDIDRPAVVPEGASCMHCGKNHSSDNPHKMVWVQSGNAAVPTKAGYFFCVECFRCHKCGFRFFNNVFHTVNGKAWCMGCVQGKPIVYPTRNWHTPFVNTYNTASRMTGHKFPRHAHQQEFLFNPNE